MTYTKPKLNNEFSKSKKISKKQRANSNNPKIINNIFDINNKVDTPMQIDIKNDSVYKEQELTDEKNKKYQQFFPTETDIKHQKEILSIMLMKMKDIIKML